MKKILSVLTLLVLLSLVGCGSEPIEVTQTDTIIHDEPTDEPTEETPDLSNSVTYEIEESTNISLLKFTNSASVDVEVEVNFVFDNNGTKEDAGYGHIYCLGAGKSAYVCMKKPDVDGKPIEGITTEVNVTVNESGLFDDNGCMIDSIAIEDSESDGDVTVSVTNNSDIDLSTVGALIIYYKGDVPVWYNDYAYDLASGNSYSWTFDKPRYYDIDSTAIDYDSYKVFVNEAYKSQY